MFGWGLAKGSPRLSVENVESGKDMYKMFAKKRADNKKRGFTLIELLVVIAIIAMLMAIVMPGLRKAKDKARQVWCLANIRGTMIGVSVYDMSNDGRLPYMPGMNPFLHFPAMMISSGVEPTKLHCPGDPYDPGSVAYWWEEVYKREITDSDHPIEPDTLGIEANVDYSYVWYVKMFSPMDAVSKYPDIAADFNGWKTAQVKAPAGLIASTCFYPVTSWTFEEILEKPIHGSAGATPGDHIYQSGFIDGHSEAVKWSEVTERAGNSQDVPPWNIMPNLDWTIHGIFGRDINQ